MNYAMLTTRARKYAAPAVPPAETWNVSTATFVRSFSVAAQDSTPLGVAISPDGTHLYVVGFSGDDINEYSLTTPWDVSTATYLQVKFVGFEDTLPRDVEFKPDGTRMYVLGRAASAIMEYSLSTAWNVLTATYVRQQSVITGTGETTGTYFPVQFCLSADGDAAYVVNFENNAVYEYSLSTPWNVSTLSFVQTFSLSAQTSNARDVAFRTNGLQMYVTGLIGNNVSGFTGGAVYEYSLTTPWDVSTATYLRSADLSAQGAFQISFAFRPDGTRMYVVDSDGDTVNEYHL